MSSYKRSKFIIFVSVFVAFLSACQSNPNKEDVQLTQQEAIEKFASISPTEGAIFFTDNRKDYPFLDTLYVENIIPIVSQCSFDTIKSVFNKIDDTPASDALAPAYNTLN